MVSNRNIKLKFSDNERVLCYEPDPTKAKVLYDSKVLDVVVTKDQRGRKAVEYLIHFQGWNSSWDRYVSEEYVLKDTPENRQLQKDLADRSQLQLGAYLYRRDRKKHSRKTSERVQSSDDGSSGSPVRMDTDDGHGLTSSSEEDSSIEEDVIPIELTPELRQCLEEDHCLINEKNKLVKLPADPNVVSILESYWKHYFNSQVGDSGEKNNVKQRIQFGNQVKRKPEDVQRNLNVCSEVLDGIRIYFDFTIKDLLLYKPEQGQIQTAPAFYNLPMYVIKEENNSHKNEINYMDYLNHSNNNSSADEDFNNQTEQALARRRTLRSNKSLDCQSNGNSVVAPHQSPLQQQDVVAEVKARPPSVVDGGPAEVSSGKMMSWRLLPEDVYGQQPPPPCLVYGAVHLTRLFVKLPELLNASNIEENKLKTLLQHIYAFVDFLNDNREWYGEKYYIDK